MTSTFKPKIASKNHKSSDSSKVKWSKHKGIEKLNQFLNFENTCGYITFVKTGVPDIGCEYYDENVSLCRPKSRKDRRNSSDPRMENSPSVQTITLQSPMDEITSFNVIQKTENTFILKSPDEDHFAVTPGNSSPSNVFRSEDCNELLAKELAGLEDNSSDQDDGKLHQFVRSICLVVLLFMVICFVLLNLQKNRRDFIHSLQSRSHSTIIP